MKERPILFSALQVQATLAGRMSQFRRVLRPETFQSPPYFFSGETSTDLGYPASRSDFWAGFRYDPDWENKDPIGSASYTRSPFGKPGDHLWVRETFFIDHIDYISGPLPSSKPRLEPGEEIYYRADGECCDQIPECACGEIGVGPTKWRPSIHMPKWAARIWLEVTDVRCERLQDISEDDAGEEGVYFDLPEDQNPPYPDKDAFMLLWDSINGDRENCAWSDNPYVWVYSFKRIEK